MRIVILRTSCLNIRWPKKLSNDEVYKRANTTPWSHQIKIRELKWFGHLMRLPENTSAKIALRHASEPHRKPRGKHATTWTTMMTNRFKELNLTWDEASESAKGRTLWRNLCMTKQK